MPKILTSCEVWDAARTARIAIPGVSPTAYDILAYRARSVQYREQLGDQGRVTLTLATGSPPVVADPPYLSRGRLLRFFFSDETFREFRIRQFKRELSGLSEPVVTAVDIEADLWSRVARRTLTGGFVDLAWTALSRDAQTLLEMILADAPEPFVAGDAGDYAEIITSIQSTGSKHGDLLKALCAPKTGLGCEWEAVYDEGDDVYEVNLVAERGGAGVRPVEFGTGSLNNRRTLDRTQDGEEYFSRISPLAGSDEELVSLAHATWVVGAASYSGGTGRTTLTLDGDPIYLTGFPGTGLEFGDASTFYDVYSTAAPATVVVTGNASALAAGRFRLQDGSDLTYLADPAAEASAGIVERNERFSDISPYDNLLVAAGISVDMRASDWAGSPSMPAGWFRKADPASTLPTVTQETDDRYTQVGGMSMKVVCTGIGQGVFTADFPFDPTASAKSLASSLGLRVAPGGAVRFEMISGTDSKSYPLGAPASSNEDALRGLKISADPPAGDMRLQVSAATSTTTFWLDSATATNSASAYDYAEQMGPVAMWHAAAQILVDEGGLQPDALEGAVFDAAHIPGTGITDEIRCGTRVQVLDAGLDLETRVVLLDEEWGGGEEYAKKVTLSRKRQDLVDHLAGGAPPRRKLPPARPAERPALTAFQLRDDDQDWRFDVVFSSAFAGSARIVATWKDDSGDEQTYDAVRNTPAESLAFMSAGELGEGYDLVITGTPYSLADAQGSPGPSATLHVKRPTTGGGASITASAERTDDGLLPAPSIINTITWVGTTTASGQEVRLDVNASTDGGSTWGGWTQIATGQARAGGTYDHTRRAGAYYSEDGAPDLVKYRARLVVTSGGAQVAEAVTNPVDCRYVTYP